MPTSGRATAAVVAAGRIPWTESWRRWGCASSALLRTATACFARCRTSCMCAGRSARRGAPKPLLGFVHAEGRRGDAPAQLGASWPGPGEGGRCQSSVRPDAHPVPLQAGPHGVCGADGCSTGTGGHTRPHKTLNPKPHTRGHWPRARLQPAAHAWLRPSHGSHALRALSALSALHALRPSWLAGLGVTTRGPARPRHRAHEGAGAHSTATHRKGVCLPPLTGSLSEGPWV
jgi:hypothetical protein